MSESSGPSRSWYAVSLALVLGAVVSAVVATLLSINAVDLRPVQFPGSVEFDVEEPGTWIVCAVTTDGSAPVRNRFDIEFVSSEQKALPLETDSMVLTYTIDGRRGIGVGHVDLPQAGRWTLSGVRRDEAVGDGTGDSFEFGPDPVDAVFRPILVGGGLAVILLTIGVGIWGLVLWLRIKALPATESGG